MLANEITKLNHIMLNRIHPGPASSGLCIKYDILTFDYWEVVPNQSSHFNMQSPANDLKL